MCNPRFLYWKEELGNDRNRKVMVKINQSNTYKGLKYKIKYNETPQNSSKVYFCCHREDFLLYFASISNEILNIKNNISIWYLDQDKEIIDCEEYFFDLSQMQLFVIPITRKFLVEKCHARMTEFVYAVEQHIPILPIVQEKGLDDLFNITCGNMQFLNKYIDNTVSISYTNRLCNFLNMILFNEDLIQQIRNTFDTYIFLSYRQKDCIYAKEIMNLIHDNELYQDIAIWYDEFLTPGEDFNDGIENAIIKSSCFIMAVTPNLVNESNYIMDIEYPLARALKKDILPIEAVKTNLKLLKKCYPGINDVISLKNKEIIFRYLKERFEGRISNKKKNDSQHNFFIGLAYLNGIDVEINRSRGVELITLAAEQGLPEACLKLVRMYRCGEYVIQNKREAAKWKEKYIDYLKSLNECDEEIIAQEYVDLGYLKREIHGFAPWKKIKDYEKVDYDESISAQMEALKYYEKRYFENKDDQFGWELVNIYSSLGDIFRVRGNSEEFVMYYEKACEIKHYILEKSSEPQAREELIISISVLASVYCDEKKFIKASEYCRQGIKKARKLLEEKFDKKLVKEVVYLYDHTLENCVKAENREDKVIENMREGIRMVGEILLDFMPSQVYIKYKRKYSRLAENAKAGEKNKEIYEQLVKILGQIILPEYDEKVTRQYRGY